jgi:hypothetical protein
MPPLLWGAGCLQGFLFDIKQTALVPYSIVCAAWYYQHQVGDGGTLSQGIEAHISE